MESRRIFRFLKLIRYSTQGGDVQQTSVQQRYKDRVSFRHPTDTTVLRLCMPPILNYKYDSP